MLLGRGKVHELRETARSLSEDGCSGFDLETYCLNIPEAKQFITYIAQV